MRGLMAKTTSFDENTEAYDEWFEKNRKSYLAELAAVRAFVPPEGKGVEIGVGTGRFAGPLDIRIGVEPSPHMAELARQRGIHVFEAPAESLPFADGEYDFALMVTVVCFLDDLEEAFREVHRILRPGGLLIIGFIDRESELGRQYVREKDQSRFYHDAVFYSVGELETCLTGTGFSNFAYRQTLFADPGRSPIVEEGYGRGSFVVVRASRL
jgi:SAM-dependent methyltransferase